MSIKSHPSWIFISYHYFSPLRLAIWWLQTDSVARAPMEWCSPQSGVFKKTDLTLDVNGLWRGFSTDSSPLKSDRIWMINDVFFYKWQLFNRAFSWQGYDWQMMVIDGCGNLSLDSPKMAHFEWVALRQLRMTNVLICCCSKIRFPGWVWFNCSDWMWLTDMLSLIVFYFFKSLQYPWYA